MIDSLNTLVRKIARDYDSDMEMKRSFALGLRFEQLKVLKKACVLNQNRKPRAKNMSGHNLSPMESLASYFVRMVAEFDRAIPNRELLRRK